MSNVNVHGPWDGHLYGGCSYYFIIGLAMGSYKGVHNYKGGAINSDL